MRFKNKVPDFFADVCRLPGKNKLNVYALLIAKLGCYPRESAKDSLMIRALSKELKILFHNHEQQFSVLAFILQQALNQHRGISENLKRYIKAIVKEVNEPAFKDYFTIKNYSSEEHHCRIGRFFESKLAVNMLMNPSPKTWQCVHKISERMIEFISQVKNDAVFSDFLKDLGPEFYSEKIPYLPLAFGRFSTRPTIENVLSVLHEKKDFVKIMLIQFMFMRDVYPLFKPDIAAWDKVRQFGYGGDLKKFIKESDEKELGSFFWCYPKFPPYLDRGRAEFISYTSSRLGISLLPEDRSEFPLSSTSWCPDCLCQKPNLESAYTKSLLEHNIPYVAGPSGMTTVLCSAMLFLGQFESLNEHHYYLMAIMAFIVGGGLHSIHEVLTIPHQRLGLLTAYNADGAHAGNYQTFFNLFSLDESIQKNIHDAWDSTIDWLYKHYPELTTKASYRIELTVEDAKKDAQKTHCHPCLIM